MPPEGLDAYAVSSKSNMGGGTTVFGNYGYVNSAWSNDYQTFQGYATTVTLGGSMFSYGGSFTTVNQFGDRDNYFLRYDQNLYGQFVSIKFIHNDFKLASIGQNIFALDYNVAFKIGTVAEFYLLAGVYYRYDLDSWDAPTWSPINLNTNNQDIYAEIVFGTRIALGAANYLTLDLNNRDPFLPYNGDNLAFDITLNLVSSDRLTIRLTESSRFSGLLVGTADINQEEVLIGVIHKL